MSAACIDDNFEGCISPQLFRFIGIVIIGLDRCPFDPVEPNGGRISFLEREEGMISASSDMEGEHCVPAGTFGVEIHCVLLPRVL